VIVISDQAIGTLLLDIDSSDIDIDDGIKF